MVFLFLILSACEFFQRANYRVVFLTVGMVASSSLASVISAPATGKFQPPALSVQVLVLVSSSNIFWALFIPVYFF
jgi:hypothetical protein